MDWRAPKALWDMMSQPTAPVSSTEPHVFMVMERAGCVEATMRTVRIKRKLSSSPPPPPRERLGEVLRVIERRAWRSERGEWSRLEENHDVKCWFSKELLFGLSFSSND